MKDRPAPTSIPGRWWRMMRTDEPGMHLWVRERCRAFLEFARNFVAGISLYAIAAAIVPYYLSTQTAWSSFLFWGLCAGGCFVITAASLSWSLSFNWKPLKRIALIFAMAVMAVALAGFNSVYEWHMHSHEQQSGTSN